jgi:outer membrane protein assembly factor BamE (lipoprotein component of BamABCDE complex)
MSKTLVIGVCLLAVLSMSGCIPDYEANYVAQGNSMAAELNACISALMTKSELLMQVGQPTSREVLDDAEIWIYQLSEQGDTVSQTEYTPGDLFSDATATTTTTAPRYKAMITVKFSKQGQMINWAMSGQNGAMYGVNNRFLSVKAPRRM